MVRDAGSTARRNLRVSKGYVACASHCSFAMNQKGKHVQGSHKSTLALQEGLRRERPLLTTAYQGGCHASKGASCQARRDAEVAVLVPQAALSCLVRAQLYRAIGHHLQYLRR